MKQRWLSFAACLCSLAVCYGATNSSPSADILLKQLAASPYDKALLATLARTAGAVSNAQDRARCLAVYCLGTLAIGDTDAANKGKSYLAKTSPSSPYLQTLSFENLSDPCPMCHGDGKVEGVCSLCRGTGKCTACRGTGTVKRSTFSGSRTVETTANCTSCRGSGECKQCKGTKTESKPCTRCAGSGKVWSPDRIKTEYLAVLAGSGSGGASASSGNALDFGDITGKPIPASTGASPTAGQVRTVEVTGTGVSADEALKDAFSSAVKTCIGVMVNAEQVVENEDVIKDEILTYSNGYIKDYDDLGSERREGLIVRRIRATVILGKLASKLREKNIAVNEVKGEALFAEAVTVNQERADFRQMLAKTLQDYNPAKLWTPQLVEKRIVSQDEHGATVAFLIRVIPDKSAIADFFAALQRVLQTKYRQERLQLVQYDNGQTHDYRLVEGLLGEGCTRIGTKDVLPFQHFPKAGSMILFVNRAASRVLTEQEKQERDNVGMDRVYTDASCYAYHIPADDWNAYFKDFVATTTRDGPVNSAGSVYLHHSQATPFIVGVLKDSAGKEIDYIETEVDYSLVGRTGFGWHGPYGSNQEAWIILLHAESYPPEQYRVPWVYRLRDRTPLVVEKTFSIDELRAIKNIELTIEMRPLGADGQTARRSNAQPPASVAAASPEPQEKQAVRLAQKAMQAGTAALGVESAVSQPEKDSESSDDGQTKAAAAVAKAGEAATVAMVQNDGKTGLTAGEVFAAIAVIVVLIVMVKFGRLVRCIVVGIATRIFGRR